MQVSVVTFPGSIPVPAGLKAKFVGTDKLRVEWMAAVHSGNLSTAVLGYNVSVFTSGVRVITHSVDNKTLTVEFSSIDECKNYTVQVAVYTYSQGLGNFSGFELLTHASCGR